MTILRFNRLARSELRDAITTYEQQVEGLGARFLDEVSAAIELLREYPEIAPLVIDSFRSFPLRSFPYSLIYRRVDEESLRILAVAHQKRRFGYWQGRR